MAKDSKQVRLRMQTYEDLDEWRSPGQTFDGAVRELLQKQQIKVTSE